MGVLGGGQCLGCGFCGRGVVFCFVLCVWWWWGGLQLQSRMGLCWFLSAAAVAHQHIWAHLYSAAACGILTPLPVLLLLLLSHQHDHRCPSRRFSTRACLTSSTGAWTRTAPSGSDQPPTCALHPDEQHTGRPPACAAAVRPVSLWLVCGVLHTCCLCVCVFELLSVPPP